MAGVAEGCVQSGAALVGGETAEMPGFYPVDEYDLAGFAVGLVEKDRILDKSRVKRGDALIALPSSGVHSNGFSLVRKVFSEDELKGSLGLELLMPTRIYVKPVLGLLEQVEVHSIAHITGGGFYENIPRALPKGLGVRIAKTDIRTPEIFQKIAEAGNIPERDMFNTFNMGVGMCITVSQKDADRAVRVLGMLGQDAYFLGEVTESGEVEIV